MKNSKFLLILCFFSFAASEISADYGPIENKHIGKYFGQAGFALGSASVVSSFFDKYGLALSFASLGVGSFLLSPLAEEIFNPTNNINMNNIYKFKKLLPCGIAGFACISLGLRSLKNI